MRKTMKQVKLLAAAILWASVFSAQSSFAADQLIMGYAEGSPGDRSVVVMVMALHDQPIHGYSLAISYPAAALSLLEISKRGTQLESLEPDFYQQQIDPVSGHAVLGVILSYQQPVTYSELPPTLPGDRPQLIARLSFDVKVGATPGVHPLRFVDGLLSPPIYNRFTHRGSSIGPAFKDGSFRVHSANILSVESKFAFPGSRGDYFAHVHHPVPIGGYQIGLAYDKRALTMEDATYASTDVPSRLTGARKVDFADIRINTGFSVTHGRVNAGVVFDYAPFEEPPRLLPANAGAAVGQSVLKFTVTVNGDADQFGESFPLILQDLPTSDAINNVFLIDGKSETPELVSGNIYFSTGSLTGRILDYTTGLPIGGVAITTDHGGFADTTGATGVFRLDDLPPDLYSIKAVKAGYFTNWLNNLKVEGKGALAEAPDLFLFPRPASTGGFKRGLVNDDTRIDISDGIVIFSFLFLGKDRPVCSKAADTNDDGRFDLSDGISLLSYLFLGSEPPRPPFVECGDDPTPDALTCDTAMDCN
jgi:hypothetical protein